MKSSTVFAFCLIAFVQNCCLQPVECNSFELADNNSNNNLLNLTILSGEFNPPKLAIWRVLVYALQTDRLLTLPINSTELDGIVHLDYGTYFVNSNGTPAWENQSFFIPADQFPDESYLAVEVHGIVMNKWEVFYHGGIELTFGQLKQLPNDAQLLVFDNAGSYGVVNVAWK